MRQRIAQHNARFWDVYLIVGLTLTLIAALALGALAAVSAWGSN